MRHFLLSLILLVLCSGCAAKALNSTPPIFNNGYSYLKRNDGSILLLTKDVSPAGGKYLDKAMKEVGCGLCTVTWAGTVYDIMQYEEVAPSIPE